MFKRLRLLALVFVGLASQMAQAQTQISIGPGQRLGGYGLSKLPNGYSHMDISPGGQVLVSNGAASWVRYLPKSDTLWRDPLLENKELQAILDKRIAAIKTKMDAESFAANAPYLMLMPEGVSFWGDTLMYEVLVPDIRLVYSKRHKQMVNRVGRDPYIALQYGGTITNYSADMHKGKGGPYWPYFESLHYPTPAGPVWLFSDDDDENYTLRRVLWPPKGGKLNNSVPFAGGKSMPSMLNSEGYSMAPFFTWNRAGVVSNSPYGYYTHEAFRQGAPASTSAFLGPDQTLEEPYRVGLYNGTYLTATRGGDSLLVRTFASPDGAPTAQFTFATPFKVTDVRFTADALYILQADGTLMRYTITAK